MQVFIGILLIFGPFFVFAAKGLFGGEDAEELTVEGVRLFFRWLISLVALTFVIKSVGLPIWFTVVVVVLHHLTWSVVAYVGRETSWKYVTETFFRVTKLEPR